MEPANGKHVPHICFTDDPTDIGLGGGAGPGSREDTIYVATDEETTISFCCHYITIEVKNGEGVIFTKIEKGRSYTVYGACNIVVGSWHATHAPAIVSDDFSKATVEFLGPSTVFCDRECAGDALNAAPINGVTVDEDGSAHTHHVVSDICSYAVLIITDKSSDPVPNIFVDLSCSADRAK